MNTKVSDLMVEHVVTARRSDTVGHARKLVEQAGIHAIPIVDADGVPVGIVSTADLVHVIDGTTPLGQVMSPQPHVIPQYNDISAAARLMRKKHIHHVLVTHEKELVGILSTFDLLKLVEDHRFVMKPGPDSAKAG